MTDLQLQLDAARASNAELTAALKMTLARLEIADATIEALKQRIGCDDSTDITTEAEERELRREAA